MNQNTSYSSIFSNEAVFRSSYLPDQPPARDKKIRDIRWAIGRPLRGKPPENISITGERSVGKTTVIHHILDQLPVVEDYVGPTNSIYYSLNRAPTSHATAAQLVNELKELSVVDQGFQTQGTSLPKIISTLITGIKQLNGYTVIVLDHAREIESATDFFATFTKQLETLYPSKVVTLITISRTSQPLEEIESSVADRLRQKEIHFPTYSQSQIEEILRFTAKEGFQANVVQEDVVPHCAALASRSGSSVVKGKQLLYDAGEAAVLEDDNHISVDHVP